MTLTEVDPSADLSDLVMKICTYPVVGMIVPAIQSNAEPIEKWSGHGTKLEIQRCLLPIENLLHNREACKNVKNRRHASDGVAPNLRGLRAPFLD